MKRDKLENDRRESRAKAREKVDGIALEVVKHMEAIQNLVTRDEFNQKMNQVLDSLDKMMSILQRLDQERVFTAERITRLEEKAN